jgi:hypothetical protein
MDDRRREWLAEMLSADPAASEALKEATARAITFAREAVARSRALRARLAAERASRARRKDEPPARP